MTALFFLLTLWALRLLTKYSGLIESQVQLRDDFVYHANVLIEKIPAMKRYSGR